MNTIALFGAGGKMGLRIANNLLKTTYAVRYVEISNVFPRNVSTLITVLPSPVPVPWGPTALPSAADAGQCPPR